MQETTQRWFMPWRWRWWTWAIVILLGLAGLPYSLWTFTVYQQQVVRERYEREQKSREKFREDLRRLGVSLHNREGQLEQPALPADALDVQPGAK